MQSHVSQSTSVGCVLKRVKICLHQQHLYTLTTTMRTRIVAPAQPADGVACTLTMPPRQPSMQPWCASCSSHRTANQHNAPLGCTLNRVRRVSVVVLATTTIVLSLHAKSNIRRSVLPAAIMSRLVQCLACTPQHTQACADSGPSYVAATMHLFNATYVTYCL